MVSKKQYINLIYPFIFALLGILYTSTYVVPEGQRALTFYVNQPIQSAPNTLVIKSPGLHFRMPFLTHFRLYEHRIQHLNIRSDQVTMHDLNNIQMEISVRYHILNPALYFAWIDKAGTQDHPIEAYIGSKLNQYLKSIFAVHTKNDAAPIYSKPSDLRVDGRNAPENPIESDTQAFLSKISAPLGIEITDTYITQLRLSETTRARLFERMKKNYEQLSAEYWAQGKITEAKIRTQALNQARELINTAQEQVANIHSKADAFAIELYNQAYQKHPKFAQFYQNLIAYQRSFDSSSPTLILFQLDKLLSSNTLTI